MPRTKQTKPRHYVEDLKKISGGAPSSTAPSQTKLDSSESNENDQDVDRDNVYLSETEDKKSHLSTSPCLCDDNNEKNTFLDATNDADYKKSGKNISMAPKPKFTFQDVKNIDIENEADEEISKHNHKSRDLSFRRESETPSPSPPHNVNLQETRVQLKQENSLLWMQQNMQKSNPEILKTLSDSNDKNVAEPTHEVADAIFTSTCNGEHTSSESSNHPDTTIDRPSSKSRTNYEQVLFDANASTTSQYCETLKKLFERDTPKNIGLNSEAWKSWLNPAQYAADFSFSNNSNLVNGYMKQILDYWHAAMQDPSVSNSVLYPYQYGGTLPASRHMDNVHSPSLSNFNPYSAVKQEHTSSKIESSFPKEPVVSPSHTNTKKEIQNHLNDREAKPLALESGKNLPEENQASCKRNHTISPKSISSAKETPSPSSSLSSFSDQRSSSAKSSNAQPYDKQTQPLINPIYPYQTWPGSAWLGYPGLARVPHAYPFSSYPSSDALSTDLTKNAKQTSTSCEKSLASKDPHSTVATSLPARTTDVNWDSQSTKTFSEPSSSSTFPGIGNGTALEAAKQAYNLPYMPYSSYWLGSVMPFSSTMPSPYASMNLNSKKSNSGMLYPRDFLQFPGLGCSPSGSSSYFSNPLYKGDHSSLNKMLGSRRSRSRSSAYDSVHAAIVREAKEQSKGVDPENMYIQCPICHKRIKRLYHFQRHMRIHTGEKTHQCPCCQYKSVRKDNLKSHMKTHEKQNLEGGRKNGKLLYQSSRSSANSTEKTQSHSPEASRSHKSAEKEHKPAENSTKDTYLSLSVEKPSRELSIEDNTRTTLPLPKLQFSDSFAYQNSIISDLNQAGREINKMSPKLSPNISQTYDDNLKRVLSDVASKNEYAEGRETYADFARVKFACSRPKSEPNTDHQQRTDNKNKKRDLIFHTLQYGGNDTSNKRRRISRERYQSGTSLSPNTMNINNNNDRSKMDNFNSSEKPLCLSSSVDNSFAKSPDISKGEISAPTLNRKKVFDRNDVATLAEMSLNQSLPHRLQLPETVTSPSSTLLQNSNHQPNEKSPDNSTGSQCQLTEEASNQSQLNTTTSVSDSQAQTFTTFSTAPSSFYSPCSPMNLLDPSKYHPLPLGLTLPPSHIKAMSDPPPKGLFQNTSSRVKKELTSKIKSKENSSDSKTEKDKSGRDSLPKSLQCRLCSFTSLSNVELQSHVTAKHKQNGFYKCEECTYLGKNLSKLVEHIRIHTGERPFKCDQCNYAAKRKDNLAQHKAVRHDKRKAKSVSQYPVMPDLKRGSLLASHLAQAGKYENSSLGLKSPIIFPQSSLSPRLNVYGNVNCGKDQELVPTNLSVSGPLTPPFHSFASMHALPTSLFQYPYYRFPSAINSPELDAEISRNAPKTVSNPASYSIKVRAALIAP